ncbi:MAG: DUF2238 domain-containing protein [Opitutaceae bacterium]
MKFPITLLIAYLGLFIVCGIAPYDRGVWIAENLPIIFIVVGIGIFSIFHRFSNLSYSLMAVLIVLHTIGGHFTFERVPFGFVSDLFDFERNHYDRIAHFSVGFYAFAIAELMTAKKAVNSRTILYLFPIFSIFTVAAVYEIFEWQFALMADPEAGIAVLGSQGDIWDAQKDMLADGLGAIAAMCLFAILRHKKASN